MKEMIKNLLENFDEKEILNLLDGKITKEDDGSVKVESENGTLIVKETPNSFSLLIESTNNPEKEEIDYHKMLIDYCEKIEDDEFFTEVCDHYIDIFGPLKDLNENTTLEGIKNFQKCVQDIALEKIKMYDDYAKLTF